ncbi:unnamed protein product [Parajaminaea phylloscopi]
MRNSVLDALKTAFLGRSRRRRLTLPFPLYQASCLMRSDEAGPDQAGITTQGVNSGSPSLPATAILTPPRLPPEILLDIFLSPCLSPVLSPAPSTTTTLHALLLCCRLSHACAKQQLNEVLVLPRHVREFRKFYDGERSRGWPGLGVTKGIFCALDDVSRLTHTSAGWETAFLRTLHLLGPRVTHLSLWHSESRVLLRDAGQVRRTKEGHQGIAASGPVWLWGQGGDEEELHGDVGGDSDAAADDGDMEEVANATAALRMDAASEVAAMRERARQQMPTWLKRELEAKPVDEVARLHRAHLTPYGEAIKGEADALEQHFVRALKARKSIKGCRPQCLSLMLSLPLFENQEPSLFASHIVFSRCQELDVYMPVPAHSAKLLLLLSHLRAAPLRRLKITTTHATLCIALPPYTASQAQALERQRRQRQRQRERARYGVAEDRQNQDDPAAKPCRAVNIAVALGSMLADADLRECLLCEFSGRHVEPFAARQLEGLLTRTAIQSDPSTGAKVTATTAARPGSPPVKPVWRDHTSDSDLYDSGGMEKVRVRLIQGHQLGHGRLRERREDFVARVMGMSQGVWEKCGMWDTAEPS